MIGLDGSGTLALPNRGDGISVFASNDIQILHNVISGDLGAGIRLQSILVGVFGNFIGTNAAGLAAVPNQGGGVIVDAGSSQIGDDGLDDGNVISGNDSGGLILTQNATFVDVQGNFIGTDVSGTYAIGNAGFGLLLDNAHVDQIGGTDPGDGNLIAGSVAYPGQPGTGSGIWIIDSGFTGSFIEGNTIGGSPSLGNAGAGIFDEGATSNIGGTAAGAANVIAYNGGAGIDFDSNAAADSRVRRNHIVGNAGPGVLLEPGASGVPFTLTPVLVSASIIGHVFDVQGDRGAPARSWSFFMFPKGDPGSRLSRYRGRRLISRQ